MKFKYVDHIDYRMGCGSEVDKQPTIHVGIGGNIDVYMKDGRVIKSLEVCWEDCPGLRVEDGVADSGDWDSPVQVKVDLTDEEVGEIENILDDCDDGLWKAAIKFSDQIDKLECSGTIKED